MTLGGLTAAHRKCKVPPLPASIDNLCCEWWKSEMRGLVASWPRSYYATILSKYSGFQVMLANNELTPIPIYIKWSRRRTQEPPSVVQACYTNPRNLPPATGTAQRSAMLQIGKTCAAIEHLICRVIHEPVEHHYPPSSGSPPPRTWRPC
jgi:hypothetical protein